MEPRSTTPNLNFIVVYNVSLNPISLKSLNPETETQHLLTGLGLGLGFLVAQGLYWFGLRFGVLLV